MNRDELREKEKENYSKILRFTHNLISKYPELKELGYSINWGLFSFINSGSEYVLKKEKNKLFLPLSFPNKKYFITFGSINLKVLDSFIADEISLFQIKLTKKPIGIRTSKGLFFPQRYAKSQIKINSFLENQLIEQSRKIAEDNIKDISLFKNELRMILKRAKPLFILLDEDQTKYKRALVSIANEYNIRSFVLQHGITLKERKNGVPFANESFQPLNADIFLCWGKRSYDYMSSFEKMKERVFIAGSPKMFFDNEQHIKIRSLLIIDQQFISQDEERRFAYEDLINKLIKESIDFNIYLRMNYNKDYLSRLAKGRIIEWKKNTIRKEILKSKCILGFTSTALLESLYSFIPVISYDYLGFNDQIGFNSEVSSSAFSLEDVIEKIREYNSVEKTKNKFISFIRENVDCEGEKSVKLIKSIVLSHI